jgi:hypothetical protein
MLRCSGLALVARRLTGGDGEAESDNPVSRKAAKYAKVAKKSKHFSFALLCASVRQPTDELL